jgi:hypothetical protein
MLAQSAEALRKIVADSKHGGGVKFFSHLINSPAIVLQIGRIRWHTVRAKMRFWQVA